MSHLYMWYVTFYVYLCFKVCLNVCDCNVFFLYLLKCTLFSNLLTTVIKLSFILETGFRWIRDQFQIRPLAIHNSRSFIQIVLIIYLVTFIFCFCDLFWNMDFAYTEDTFRDVHFQFKDFIKGSPVSFLCFSCMSGWCVHQNPELLFLSALYDHPTPWLKLHAPVIWSLVNFRSLFYEDNYPDLVLLLIILDLGPNFALLGFCWIYLAMLRRAKYVTWGTLLYL